MMVDMGAGTTELSVSRLTDPGADAYITCYSDKSVRLGGDDFRTNDMENAQSKRTHWIKEEKRLKTGHGSKAAYFR